MRTLYLLRHAKSDWSDPDLADFDRPLSPRGRRAAPAVAGWMTAAGHVPEFVACSTARRAAQTWSLAARTLDRAPAAEMRDDLYLATAERLLSLARGFSDRCASAMIVGHNPGLHDLARALAGDGPAGLLSELSAAYPTGALAGIAFEAAAWPHIAPGGGRLICFVRPRALS